MNTAGKTHGRVFDIQRFCVHDGPGIRTTVFLKGCPLRCAWCHNPESWAPFREIMHAPASCIGCGACVDVCKTSAHKIAEGVHSFDRTLCERCTACCDVCPTEALSACGDEVSVADVMRTVLRDRDFYREDGGLTISGGEPLDQFEDLLELCRMFSEAGKKIWVYTGNVVDPTKRTYQRLAQYVEVIVDGRFVEEQKGCDLLFRGSANQRLINLPMSVVMGEIVEWEDK